MALGQGYEWLLDADLDSGAVRRVGTVIKLDHCHPGAGFDFGFGGFRTVRRVARYLLILRTTLL